MARKKAEKSPPEAWLKEKELKLVDQELGLYERKIRPGWCKPYTQLVTVRRYPGDAWEIETLDPFGEEFNETGCCGVSELRYGGERDKKELKRSLALARMGVFPSLGGMIMATATNKQKAYAKLLEEEGFRAVESVLNPNTSHTVTLYVLVINQEKKLWKNL